MLNEQRFFNEFVRLTGRMITVGLSPSAEQLQGTVLYTMFDSFLLETEKGKRVVPFADIVFLDEMDSAASKSD